MNRRATRTGRLIVALSLTLAVFACDDDLPPPVGVTPPPPPPPGPVLPPCPELDMHLHVLAIARPPGGTVGAAVQDSYVFGAQGAGGVYVADVLDPADVRVVGTFPQFVDARDVAVSGSRLYVADGTHGLAIVDISDPANPTAVGSLALPGAAVDVAAVDSRAYVANDPLGLVIVDAQNPSQPRILGIENTPGKPVGVAVSGPVAFVADQTDGLRVVDVADPATPYILTTVTVPSLIQAVAADGDVVAVAAREGGLNMIDASLPAQASLTGQITTASDAVGVALGGGVAYVAAIASGIDVIDVTDIGSPQRIQTVGTTGNTVDIALGGDRVVSSENLGGARVLDVRNPMPPAIGQPVTPPLTNFSAVVVAAMGDYLVAVNGTTMGTPSLEVVAQSPDRIVGTLAQPFTRPPTDIAIVDSMAYIATSNGVPVIDLHNPAAPVLVKTVSSGLTSVAVLGHSLVEAGGNGYVVEIDLDGVTAPKGVTISGGLPTSVAADDDYTYMTDRRGFLWVIARANYVVSSRVTLLGSGERVIARQENGRPTVYVAVAGPLTSQASIDCYDLSSPASPQLLWRAMCGGDAQGVDITGEWMVVAEGIDGTEMFAIDPAGAGARPVGFIPGKALRAVFSGHRIGIAAGTLGGVIPVPITNCLQ